MHVPQPPRILRDYVTLSDKPREPQVQGPVAPTAAEKFAQEYCKWLMQEAAKPQEERDDADV